MEKQYALGIDIGTTAVKVLLISQDGRLVCELSRPHDLISLHTGWAEEKPEIWWENVVSALRELTMRCQEEASQIAAIGVSGMVPALVFLDSEGKVLRNSIQQNDARCVEEIREVRESILQKELFERTGGYTNQQHFLPRLLWVLRHEPEIMEKTAHIVGSYDYITWRLTGVLQVEKNFAVESGLYDIRNNNWIPEYLEPFGIKQEILPEVNDSTKIVGFTRDLSKEMGLPDGIPVIAGSADHVASALACGMTREGKLLVKFGGAGDILYCVDQIQPVSCLFWDEHVIPGKYLINGCTATSGSLLKWVVRKLFADPDEDAFQKYDRLAETVPAGSHGLVMLPYFLGEKTPLFDPEAGGTLVGLKLSHTREDIYHAALEAVVYSFRHHLEVLQETGFCPVSVAASDGGARSPLWCQITANALKRPVRACVSHPGSALGVAYTAGMAAGLFPDWDGVERFLGEYRDYLPDKEAGATYDKAYGIYRDLYAALKDADVFHHIAEL